MLLLTVTHCGNKVTLLYLYKHTWLLAKLLILFMFSIVGTLLALSLATQTNNWRTTMTTLEYVAGRLKADYQYQYSISAKDLGELTDELKNCDQACYANDYLQSIWNSTPLNCRLWSALYIHCRDLNIKERQNA